MLNRARWLLLLVFASSCASSIVNVRGKDLRRATFSYTDNHLYWVTHHDAYPDVRGASDKLKAYAGRITGYACGADIWAESDYRFGYLGIVGYVEPTQRSSGVQSHTRPMHLEVRDAWGERHIRGSIGDDIGEMFTSINDPDKSKGAPGVTGDVGAPYNAKSHTIDFALSSSSLHGTIGSRQYDLHADGNDNLVGTVVIGGQRLPFMLLGVAELWSMPPSDQATILPMILTCEDLASEATGIMDFSLPPILTVSFARNHIVR
jgi:hypothetical protein